MDKGGALYIEIFDKLSLKVVYQVQGHNSNTAGAALTMTFYFIFFKCSLNK